MKTIRHLLAVALIAFLPASVRAAPGDLDAAFKPNAYGAAYSTAVQPDGKIVVAGILSYIDGIPHNAIARLNSNATLDTSFNPEVNYSVIYSTAVQADGKIVIAGSFSDVGGMARNGIARLNADGAVDPSFNPNVNIANGQIVSLALQPDGKIIIAGVFTEVGGLAHNVARLNADGTVDPGFHPDVPIYAYGAAVQSDGKIVILGVFGPVDGVLRSHIARLNADGTLDIGFDPNPDGIPQCVAVQPDGKIVMAGLFLSLRPNGAVMSTTRHGIARLNPDGSLDPSFDPNLGEGGSYVQSAVLQADGKIIIGGSFGFVGGVTRNNVARLNADGTLDTTFNPNANNLTFNTTLQGDGKILIGGTFDTVGGVTRGLTARLDNDPATQSLTVPAVCNGCAEGLRPRRCK